MSHGRDGTRLERIKQKTAHTVVDYAGDLEAPCWVVFVANRSGEVVTSGDITCISLGDEDFLSL